MAAPYLRDPQAIYRESFAAIRLEIALDGFPPELRALVIRLCHAVGDTAIAGQIRWTAGAVSAGRRALDDGVPILVDAAMVAHGITRKRLRADNPIRCHLDDPELPQRALDLQTTRSAAAVDCWRDALAGSIVAIGNAPTALFRLLEIVAETGLRPALILGFPVGFVGAAESKQALVETDLGLDYVTLLGRRGGSALASAAVNALAGDPREGVDS